MDKSENQKLDAAPEVPDEELDALLDSALDDFDKPLNNIPLKESKVNNLQEQQNASTKEEYGSSNSQSAAEGNSVLWGKEYEQFQDSMLKFLEKDPKLKSEMDTLTNFANAAAKNLNLEDFNLRGEDFASTVADTLKGLAENTQSLTEPGMEDLSRLLADMGMADGGLGSGDDQVPDLMPFMHNVMQSLLSKELLYPALKDIINKYPDWLASNKTSVDKEQFEKYSHQFELMKEVCYIFESEENSEEAKKRNFEKVFCLMQKMQDCGQPPKELVGEISPEFPVDEQGNLKLPVSGMPEQCSIM